VARRATREVQLCAMFRYWLSVALVFNSQLGKTGIDD
jgi:hypothetical protein